MTINKSEVNALLAEADFSFLHYMKHPKRDLINLGLSESLIRNACLFLEMFMETILTDSTSLSAIYLYRLLAATNYESYGKTLYKITHEEDPTRDIREAFYRLGHAYLDASWRRGYFRSLRVAYTTADDLAMRKFFQRLFQGVSHRMAKRLTHSLQKLLLHRTQMEQDTPTDNQHWVRRLRYYSDNIELSERRFQYFIGDMRRQNNNLPNARQLAYDLPNPRSPNYPWNVIRNIHRILDNYLRYTATDLQSFRPKISTAANDNLQKFIEAELVLRVCKYKFDLLHHYVWYYTTPASQEKSMDVLSTLKLQRVLFGDALMFVYSPMCIERYQYAYQQLRRSSTRQELDTAIKMLLQDDGELLTYYRDLHVTAKQALEQLLYHYPRFSRETAFSIYRQHDAIRYVSQQIGRAMFLAQGVAYHNYILRHYESEVIDYFVVEALVQQAIRHRTHTYPQKLHQRLRNRDPQDLTSTEKFYCRHVVFAFALAVEQLQRAIPKSAVHKSRASEGPLRLATILKIQLPPVAELTVNALAVNVVEPDVRPRWTGLNRGYQRNDGDSTGSNAQGIFSRIPSLSDLRFWPVFWFLLKYSLLFLMAVLYEHRGQLLNALPFHRPGRTAFRLKVSLAILLSATLSYWAFHRMTGDPVAESAECDCAPPALNL